ncbi:MAG TPA: serine hydrolase domain-containing protein [Urbifossiella sp.]|jgi:CubicO group peptidase (beta-lactamase class C family)|nr:serine hydrolase domain-containing protein [Urbifossiella sp.]
MPARRVALFVAPLLLIPALAPAQTPDAAKLAAIKPAMQRYVDSGDLAGAVTLVGRAAGVIEHEAVGYRDLAAQDPMQKDTLFRIASMTKPITAIAVMILVDEGKLSPDDDLAKHIPAFADLTLAGGAKPARAVKLRDLLTHTSGLANYPPDLGDVYGKRDKTLAETTAAVAKLPLMFEPGTKWSYCNPGIDTLGRVVEVASGKAFEAFVKERVLDPLAMADTRFYPAPSDLKRLALTYGKGKDGKLAAAPFGLVGLPENPKHPIPAGGLISTAADQAKVYRMMLNKGALAGKRVLSEKAVAEMTKMQTGDIKTGFVDGMSFGYGWAVVKEPKGVTAMLSPGTFGHGGAFGTQGWIDPKQDVFAILMIQRTGLPNGDASDFRKTLQELAVAAVK